MMVKKIGIRTNSEMRIDHTMMIGIGQTKIDAMIIGEMIDMMITDEMKTVEMIIIGIIVTVIIHQGMIRGHTKVTYTMMIDEGMMIIVNTMRIEGMIIEDPKDLDNSNIIQRVETMQNLRIFSRKRMKREKLVDRRCQIAILAGKLPTMQISVRRRTKGKS